VPKLCLGMPLRRETPFPRRGSLREGFGSVIASEPPGILPEEHPTPRETEFRPHAHAQTEFGHEGEKSYPTNSREVSSMQA